MRLAKAFGRYEEEVREDPCEWIAHDRERLELVPGCWTKRILPHLLGCGMPGSACGVAATRVALELGKAHGGMWKSGFGKVWGASGQSATPAGSYTTSAALWDVNKPEATAFVQLAAMRVAFAWAPSLVIGALRKLDRHRKMPPGPAFYLGFYFVYTIQSHRQLYHPFSTTL